jgi:predicted nucleotidyltransferase
LGYATQEPLLREALRPLLARLKAAWILGSVAKETGTWQSHIDIMLIGKNLLLGDILKHLTPLEAELGRITWYA